MAATRRLVLFGSGAGLGLAAARAAAQGTNQGTTQGHDHAAPAAPAPEGAQRTPSAPDAYLYIGWPQDGETVTAPFKVWFGLRNFGVAPAGVTKAHTGHHHLLVDTPLPPLDQEIPNDRNHLHFGLGQTETVLDLPPGTHTLQLLLGDANHVPHDPPVMSKRITIHVRARRSPVTAATQ